ALGIVAERVVDARVKGRADQRVRTTGRSLGLKRAGGVINLLGRDQGELEIHDGAELRGRGRRAGLGMSQRRVHRLVRQVSLQVGLERGLVGQGLNRLPPVENNGAQKATV